tara:strand:+ start:391 stop:606 length:216 start_codon:yes stop_codon:yes gene_type:complete
MFTRNALRAICFLFFFFRYFFLSDAIYVDDKTVCVFQSTNTKGVGTNGLVVRLDNKQGLFEKSKKYENEWW